MKSASFPVMGKNTAAYHTPGAEITGNLFYHNERVIIIDDLLTSPVSIANIDEAKSQFDVRSEYSKQCGEALALAMDKNVQRNIVLAARASATVTDGDGGSVLTNASYATSGATLASGIYAAAQKLDEKNVTPMDRYVFLKPAQYYLLTQTPDVMNTNWGGAGSYSKGIIPEIANISIFKTNNVPQADDSSNTAIPSAYRANFSTTVGTVHQKQAVGTVKLLDMGIDMEYSASRQATLIVAKYAVGHGILRPECAIELKTS